MAKQESMITNYKIIYLDIISKKFPSKTDTYDKILSKKILSNYDVIVLNKELFPNAMETNRRRNNHIFDDGPTYMVGGKEDDIGRYIGTPAVYPLSVYKNGEKIGNGFQGTHIKPIIFK